MCRKWREDEWEGETEKGRCRQSSAARLGGSLAWKRAMLRCFVLYFHLFLSGFLLFLYSCFFLAASLKDNNINAGNLNGRAQWMKFANIFQKLNFSGKFFLPLQAVREGQRRTMRWMDGMRGQRGVVKDCRLAVYENKWRKLIWSTLKCKNA